MDHKDDFHKWLYAECDYVHPGLEGTIYRILTQYEQFLKDQPAPLVSFEGTVENHYLANNHFVKSGNDYLQVCNCDLDHGQRVRVTVEGME